MPALVQMSGGNPTQTLEPSALKFSDEPPIRKVTGNEGGMEMLKPMTRERWERKIEREGIDGAGVYGFFCDAYQECAVDHEDGWEPVMPDELEDLDEVMFRMMDEAGLILPDAE